MRRISPRCAAPCPTARSSAADKAKQNNSPRGLSRGLFASAYSGCGGWCEAVGRVRIGGTSRTPSPTGWCEAVGQVRIGGTSRTPSPTGGVQNAGAVRRPREGQAPPLRGECEAVGRVRIGGTSGTPAGGASPSPTGGCEAVGRVRIRGTSGTPSPTGGVQKTGVVRRPREGQAPPLRGKCEAVRCRRRGGRPRPPADMDECWRNGPPGASAPTGWCEAVGQVRIRGTSRTPSPTGGRQAVRFRRRGGRPRPPADMDEGWRNGPPGASDHTGVRPWVWVRICGTSRTPSPTGWCEYRGRCRNGGRGKPLPYGVSAKPFVSVVGAAALGRPRAWMKVGETGRRGRRPLRSGAGAAKRFNHFNINRANPYAGTDSPDAFVMDSFFAARAADSRPYGDGRARCETNTGRRGRRPLRDGAKP